MGRYVLYALVGSAIIAAAVVSYTPNASVHVAEASVATATRLVKVDVRVVEDAARTATILVEGRGEAALVYSMQGDQFGIVPGGYKPEELLVGRNTDNHFVPVKGEVTIDAIKDSATRRNKILVRMKIQGQDIVCFVEAKSMSAEPGMIGHCVNHSAPK